MAYDNNFTGVLFKNDRKKEDKHPDYTGSATIDGRDYYIDVWIKNHPKSPDYKPDKKTFQSLRFKLKENQGQPKANQPERKHLPPPPLHA